MPKVLVSNNSELMRHLAAAPVRRLNLDIVVAQSGTEALERAAAEQPDLAILDAELAGTSGYEAARQLKERAANCKVVLVMGKRINADQMRKVAASGCDEILIAPMSADELYDVVAIQLGLSRRGAERFSIDLAVVSEDGERSVDGRVTNLSVDGARLVLPDPIAEGESLKLIITSDDVDAAPIEVAARVVWSQDAEAETIIGAAFGDVPDDVRARLSRITQWEIVEDTERTRVVLKGDITEATNFADLLPVMGGRVDFDLSQVAYINSLGVREWCKFLNAAPIQGYEFHACSVHFVLQASLVEDMVGRGTVTSFFAPYHCESCDLEEERLLQSATILVSENREPPVFTCPSCNGEMTLDDIPERYFAFLLPRSDTSD